jgi:hypothetical protein
VGVDAAITNKITNSKTKLRELIDLSETEDITINRTAIGNPALEISPIIARSGSGTRHKIKDPQNALKAEIPEFIIVTNIPIALISQTKTARATKTDGK